MIQALPAWQAGSMALIPDLATERLVLRRWRESDRAPFAAMNADTEVMADLGGPLLRAASDAKFEAFSGFFNTHGYSRWVVEGSLNGSEPIYLGYAGIKPHDESHTLGAHSDIGWRFSRAAWGHGFATEAAAAALHDAFTRVGLTRVLSYTAPDNARSQAVMRRLGLERDESLDFTMPDDVLGEWHGLVWVATAPTT